MFDNPLSNGVTKIEPLAEAMTRLTQEKGGPAAVARALRISTGNVVAYAAGTQQPSTTTCRKIAALCGGERDLAFWKAVSRGERPASPVGWDKPLW